MEPFNWIALGVVSWSCGQLDVEGQGHLAQQVAGELSSLVRVDLFGGAKSRENLMC
jgi:hypothetical protein